MKKRILACALACAMLLMGTGYAYWTDLLNVTATAETGKLDVDFTSGSYVTNNFVKTGDLADESAYDSTTHPAADASIKTDANNLSISITELYPGHYQEYTAEVDNVGTVAAKLGKITAGISGDSDLTKKMIGIAITSTQSFDTTSTVAVPNDAKWQWVFHSCDRNGYHNHPGCTTQHYNNNGVRGYDAWEYASVGTHNVTKTVTDTDPVNTDALLGLPAGSTFTIGSGSNSVTFVRLSALKDINLSSNLLYLTNNSKMNFNIWIGMDPDAAGTYTTGSAAARVTTNNDSYTEHTSASVTLGFVWDQYNE